MMELPDRYCEPMWKARRRAIVLPWLIWALTIPAIIVFVVMISGCASQPIPLCEKYTYQLVQDENGQVLFAMDMENTKKMLGIVRAVQEGKCRVAFGTES